MRVVYSIAWLRWRTARSPHERRAFPKAAVRASVAGAPRYAGPPRDPCISPGGVAFGASPGSCGLQNSGRASVHNGSCAEMLRLSISRLLFPPIADAATPPGTPPWPRRGYRPPPARSGRATARAPGRSSEVPDLAGSNGTSNVERSPIESMGSHPIPLILLGNFWDC
jgi:hypothetical protein